MLVIEAIAVRGQPVSERLRATFDETGGTIGRGSASTLVLPDPDRRISRTQATIGFQAGAFVITDQGTLNPLAVNGRALGGGVHTHLEHGDELTVGPYRLLVHLEDMPQRTPAAPATADVQGSAGSTEPLTSPPKAASSDPLAGPPPDGAPLPQPQSAAPASSPQPASGPIGSVGAVPDFDPLGASADSARENPSAAPQPKHPPSHVAAEIDQIFKFRDARVEPFLRDDWILNRPAPVSPLKEPASLGMYRFVPQEAALRHVPVLYDYCEPLPSLEAEPCAPAGLEVQPAQSVDEPPGAAQTFDALDPTSYPGCEAAPASHPATPCANAGDLSAQLAEAFLRGAGVNDVKLPNGMTPELIEIIGRILRESVQGTLDLLFARSEVKVEIQSDATLIAPRDNNPLKFSPNAEVALSHLLEPKGHGFMTPIRAMRDAYEDLRAHQSAVLAGMQAALNDVMVRFRPEWLEVRLKQRSVLDNLLPVSRKARQWDLFTEVYRDVSAEAKDSRVMFGKEFQRAYESRRANRPSRTGKANASPPATRNAA